MRRGTCRNYIVWFAVIFTMLMASTFGAKIANDDVMWLVTDYYLTLRMNTNLDECAPVQMPLEPLKEANRIPLIIQVSDIE